MSAISQADLMCRTAGGAYIVLYVCAPTQIPLNCASAATAALLRRELSALSDRERLSARPHLRLGPVQAEIHTDARRSGAELGWAYKCRSQESEVGSQNEKLPSAFRLRLRSSCRSTATSSFGLRSWPTHSRLTVGLLRASQDP
jgi:hypothetical protein